MYEEIISGSLTGVTIIANLIERELKRLPEVEETAFEKIEPVQQLETIIHDMRESEQLPSDIYFTKPQLQLKRKNIETVIGIVFSSGMAALIIVGVVIAIFLSKNKKEFSDNVNKLLDISKMNHKDQNKYVVSLLTKYLHDNDITIDKKHIQDIVEYAMSHGDKIKNMTNIDKIEYVKNLLINQIEKYNTI